MDNILAKIGVERQNTLALLIAFALASIVPVELFLFSYIVLGPLHYLTEIQWLRQRQYFLNSKYSFAFFFCVAFILLASSLALASETLHLNINQWLPQGAGVYLKLWPFILFLLFFSILVLTVFGSWGARVFGALAVVFTLCFVITQPRAWSGFILFCVYLTTIIHVWLFTILFMAYGYMKNSTTVGRINLLLFALLPALFFAPMGSALHILHITPSPNLLGIYHYMMKSVHEVSGLNLDNLEHSMRVFSFIKFIAFIYTYHYLNWFTKTRIIGWHRIRRAHLVLLTATWLFTISLYFIDIRLGFLSLFVLSLGHVLLEFPLNAKTLRDLSQAIGVKV